MANNYFSFKKFTIYQDRSAFKVGTDSVLLAASADLTGVRSALDIGSGTGLISIMLAQRSKALITAIEPDQDSYLQCCENVGRCDWKDRIKVLNSDLQSFTTSQDKFDLIITNPPFFTHSLKNPDARKSASRHNDSLTAADILKGTLRLLTDNGLLQIILPYMEGNNFIIEASEYGFFCNSIVKIKPLPSSEIKRLILTFSKLQKKTVEKFLTIEYARHQFTEEYISLTKDFYLKF